MAGASYSEYLVEDLPYDKITNLDLPKTPSYTMLWEAQILHVLIGFSHVGSQR